MVAMVLAFGGVGCSTDGQPEGPRTMVFSDEAVCVDLTGADSCSQVMCDLIPEGKTEDEVCGPYFQEGLTTSELDDAGIQRIIEQRLLSCWHDERPTDTTLVATNADREWVRVAGPATWIATVADLVGADCEA